jgi:DNA-directed RNA polymerase subunit beta'
VDVAHDVIVREEDCGTSESYRIFRGSGREKYFGVRVVGRVAAEDVKVNGKKLLLKGEIIDSEKAVQIENGKIDSVAVRSPLTCESRYGICATCYGWDFSCKQMVEVGVPVGVVAAQSIGEPGTQLTLKTKHSGGVVGLDVTQGLPRVEELFEVRMPRGVGMLSEVAGKVKVEETDAGYRVTVRSIDVKPVEERVYELPLTAKLVVKSGDLVGVGTRLSGGHLDIREVLSIRGLVEAEKYLITELQAVYESQGIPIHDKHFEVIVRKMSDKVRASQAGDTKLLLGEVVGRTEFEGENERVLAEGGEVAVGQVVIMGITRSALYTESWLSAASFERTTSVLTDAALEGKEDKLLGLKENVIIGRLIPVSAERARMSY